MKVEARLAFHSAAESSFNRDKTVNKSFSLSLSLSKQPQAGEAPALSQPIHGVKVARELAARNNGGSKLFKLREHLGLLCVCATETRQFVG